MYVILEWENLYGENEQLHILFSDHNFLSYLFLEKITIANKSLLYIV